MATLSLTSAALLTLTGANSVVHRTLSHTRTTRHETVTSDIEIQEETETETETEDVSVTRARRHRLAQDPTPLWDNPFAGVSHSIALLNFLHILWFDR